MSLVTRTRTRGSTHVLLAACLWGTTGTVRTAVEAASNVSIAAVRVVVGGSVLLAIAARSGRSSGGGRGVGLRRLVGTRGNHLALAAGAVAIAVYQTAFFSAAARTGVAVGTVVTIGSAPAFTGLLAVVTRRAPLTRRWLLATAGAVTGCAALVLSGGGGGAAGGGGGPDPVGVALALLAGLAYAVYTTVVSALIGRGEDERAVTGALFGVSAVLMAPPLVTGAAAWTLGGRGAAVALYLGAVTTAGGYLLLARGLRTTPATTATTLTLAEPAVAAVLGVVVLHESLHGIALGGIGLLAASLVLLLIPQEHQGDVVDGVTLPARNC
jgi:drug/metabolite transporter, DME family